MCAPTERRDARVLVGEGLGPPVKDRKGTSGRSKPLPYREMGAGNRRGEILFLTKTFTNERKRGIIQLPYKINTELYENLSIFL